MPLTAFSSEGPVRQTLGPFRRKADAKPGRDQRHQRIGVVAAIGDVAGQIVFFELLVEVLFGVAIALRRWFSSGRRRGTDLIRSFTLVETRLESAVETFSTSTEGHRLRGDDLILAI